MTRRVRHAVASSGEDARIYAVVGSIVGSAVRLSLDYCCWTNKNRHNYLRFPGNTIGGYSIDYGAGRRAGLR